MAKKHLNGISMYYEDAGEGEPILFIHGLGSSTRDWQAQIDFFSKRYRPLAYDVRGHGRTDKPPGPYSVSQFSEDAAHLLRDREAFPAHVVGLSMGGMIAFQLVLDHPDLVRSMVIVNSGPAFLVKTLPQRLLVFQRLFISRVLGMRAMGKFLSRRLFPEPGQNDLARTMIDRWAENDRWAYRASFKALLGWSVLNRIRDITTPTLVVAARYDYTPVELKQAYASAMPCARIGIIEHSRHLTPVDQPQQFNEMLLEFFSSLEKSS
ncbi:MAG TPA: alpha/beta fold hydrolase [Deltaproteobacteria bacterium]|nr:alpha/beta fold hydrolase [Deltaproteobacteria bacterium]